MFSRHHDWCLHPFCLAERPKNIEVTEAFLSYSPREAKRWRPFVLEPNVVHQYLN